MTSRTVPTRFVVAWILVSLQISVLHGETHLVDAVQRGDVTRVERLLEQGADVDSTTPDGTTAVLWAAHLDRIDIAKLLVRAGSKVSTANRYGVTPLMQAATNGNAELVALLLDAETDANAKTPQGETLLMIAARTGKPEAVRTLLEHGANPNTPEDRRGQTALMWAAAEGHVQTVQTLIDAGAELDAESKRGFTAFLFAVRQGKIDVVRTLLRHQAEIMSVQNMREAPDSLKQSREQIGRALCLAVSNAHFELAALLLEAGADPDFVWKGRAALHRIISVRKPGTGTHDPPPPGSGTMTSLELVGKLAERGADLDLRMTTGGYVSTGATAFLLAAHTADAGLMRLLADLGADPLIPNKAHSTPLMVAAGVGVKSPGEDAGTPSEVYEAVKVALALGGNVNAVNDRGETAMHGAAYKYADSVVPLLIENGAKIEIWNQKNRQGWTPLRIAAGIHRTMNLRKSPEVAAELRKAMMAAGVSTHVDPETNISGGTR